MMLAYRKFAALAAIPAILLPLAAGAQALQTGPVSGPVSGPAAAPPLVTVNGQRLVADPTQFLAANSPVLNSSRASSCSYLSGYNVYDDDEYVNYLLNFYPDGRIPGLAVFSDLSPFGDASTEPRTTGLWGMGGAMGVMGRGACGGADLRFAAGRHAIERKDQTLARAIAAYRAGDYSAALAGFKANYDKLGYDISALMVADMYRQGIGVPADSGQAVAWLDKIVNARFNPRNSMRFDPRHPDHMSVRAEAAMTLARMVQSGQGVARDPAAARKYYQLAADAGYVPAEAILAQDYLAGGNGVSKDVDKGVKMLERAGEAGYAPALYQLGRMYYSGDAGLAQDLQRAGAYYAAAARLGDARAQYAAANMYDHGEGVPVDQQRAIALYKEAAVKGYPAAQNALATYFYTGEVVDKNLDTARKLFKEAAMRGEPEAMFNLGVMTNNGEGGPQDLAMAYVWYRLAQASGKADAAVAARQVAPRLTSDQRRKADAILAPAPLG
ncbi:tetratricopeptide repeat protein [Oxalobacteraceae bacterium A2-2]